MNYKSILRSYSRYVFYALIGLLLCSCSKDDDDDDNSPINISGEWVVDKFNGNILLTNNIIIYEINSPTTLRESFRKTHNEKNNKWIVGNFPYNLSGDKLLMNESLNIKVEKNSDNEMRWSIDDEVYHLIRITKNYTTEIIGLWEGKCITAGESDDPHRWQYRSDGTYSYFAKDTNGEWKEKEDNASKYILHGNFLIPSWYNDDATGTQGENCEVWDITIEKDKMTWRATRENGKTIEFAMTRVGS